MRRVEGLCRIEGWRRGEEGVWKGLERVGLK